MYLLYNCFIHIRLDLTERLKKQLNNKYLSNSIDVYSNNDCSERGVGMYKQNKKMKQNVSRPSNEGTSMAKNNDIFDTFEGVNDCDQHEFARMITVWHSLASYRE